VAIAAVVNMKEYDDGIFVNGAFTPNDFNISDRRKQTIEIEHSLVPYKASIKLNGQSIRCRRYEVLIELGASDVEFKSESSVMFIEVEGMRFKRVE
jgi:hypothetical protein